VSFTAARIVQGIGGAMMVPVGRLAVLRATPKDDLMRAIMFITWPGLVAPVIGPPLGGVITTYSSWGWVFYLNLPLGLSRLPPGLAFYPCAPGPRTAPVRRAWLFAVRPVRHGDHVRDGIAWPRRHALAASARLSRGRRAGGRRSLFSCAAHAASGHRPARDAR